LTALAERLGLLQTGASDYHGQAGKPNRLGENLTSPQVLGQILAQGQLGLVGGGLAAAERSSFEGSANAADGTPGGS
jgi:hypothetical protein